MNLRPLNDRIVVRRIVAEEKTVGGIILPETAQEKPMEGEVIAAGPGARNAAGALVPLDVAVGDRVLFGKWSGTEVKVGGQDLLIMKESDVMGIIPAAAPKAAPKAAAKPAAKAAPKAAAKPAPKAAAKPAAKKKG